MKVREAAVRLEVGTDTVYSLVAAGKLRCCRVGMGRGSIRISEEQIVEYLKSCETGGMPPQPAPQPARKITLKHLRLG
jgi:excisionase family DNA binding protein